MNKRKTILVLILLAVGIGILCYPAFSNFINQLNGSLAIQQLQENMESEDVAKQRARAEAYNRKVRTAPDELSEAEYEGILNIANGMMGYLQIPAISVTLPIYHGVSEEVLRQGVGHLPQSAFPIGGAGNHAVLTGHTGLPSAELFTDLTQLREGERFYVTILGETLVYEIDQIKVVLPDEGEDLAPVAGMDYCTLVTCTPYGVNSQRLLVRGHRVEAEQEEILLPLENPANAPTGWPVIWLLLTPVPVLVILIGLIMRKKRK